ncbi:MAG: UDP-N-acetylmuramoyl-tripeptide--D-alanyl-D-alanine ligase [Gemmatimonadales bacterium]
MKRWTTSRVTRALGVTATAEAEFSSISTDTRTLEPGALFVALAGERFDGHEFLEEARARGAAGAVVRRGTPPLEGVITFEVDDPLRALGLLARERRREITGPVVGVTGTNGKTATKEMLDAVLGTRWQVHATRDNLNNLVGVPLTILSAPGETDALVVEAGANMVGEIGRLREIIEPDVAVITNVSTGHTEGFGSLEGVLEEKVALLDGASLAVVGTEPPALAARSRWDIERVVVAGCGAGADVRPDGWGVREDGRGWLRFRGESVTLPVFGHHQVENAMLALAVGIELGVPVVPGVAALGKVQLPPGRCQVRRFEDLTVLDDSYNANPASVAALLETARVMRRSRRMIVVLGSMLELGPVSDALHREVADRVMEQRPDLVAAVGAFADAFERHRPQLGDRLLTAGEPDTLGRELARRLTGGELILVKASRGVGLERVIPHLIPDGDL